MRSHNFIPVDKFLLWLTFRLPFYQTTKILFRIYFFCLCSVSAFFKICPKSGLFASLALGLQTIYVLPFLTGFSKQLCHHTVPEYNSETHFKRQATQHDSLATLLGGGDKRYEMVYGEENNILNWAE
jgi:hypothetical protein